MPRVRDRMSAECEPRISGRRAAVRTSLRDSASAHRSAAREQASQASATHPQSTRSGVHQRRRRVRCWEAAARACAQSVRAVAHAYATVTADGGEVDAIGCVRDRSRVVGVGELEELFAVAGSQTIAKHWWFTPPYSANESLRVVSGGGYRNTWRSSTPCSRDREIERLKRHRNDDAAGLQEGRDLDVPYKAFTAQRHVYNAGTTHDEQSVGRRAVRRFPSA